MKRRILLIIAKFLINSGILCMLPLPLLTYDLKFKIPIALFALALIFVGCVMCIVTNIVHPNITSEDEQPKRFPMMWYFKTIKWLLIVAVAYHIIAACIILLFYGLKHEMEATLMIVCLSGIIIGLVCNVSIPYYKYYKKNKCSSDSRRNNTSHEQPKSYPHFVGSFSENPVLDIYIKSHDGSVPRFYIKSHKETGDFEIDFHTCVRFQSNSYFKLNEAKDVLTEKQKTELIEYLESGVGAYTNWYRLIDAWNSGNFETQLQCWLEMPDYSTL